MTTTTKPDTALVPTLPATCEVQGYRIHAAHQEITARVMYAVFFRDALERVVLVTLPPCSHEVGTAWVNGAAVPAPAVYAEAQRVVREMWGVSL